MALFTRDRDVATGGFAVIDVETTGLSPRTNRVVEVAVVHLDPNLDKTYEFTTLVNPGRDVGATHIHGIAANDVAHAPTFADIAPMLLPLLAGRVLVGHNVTFDLRFIHAEFDRAGVELPELCAMCTMGMAPQYLQPLPARSLIACCEVANVRLEDAHTALADANAAASLLVAYRAGHRSLPDEWRDGLRLAARTPWPEVNGAAVSPVSRSEAAALRSAERGYLARLVAELPRGDVEGEVEAYLSALDSALEDRTITREEADQLHDLALDLGLSAELVASTHRGYVAALARAAWDDGVVSAEERHDLNDVGQMLGVHQTIIDAALSSAEVAPADALAINGAALRVGDRICITGETMTPREQLDQQARSAGLRVMTSVSRKTVMVVAADPTTESTKARRAREFGVRLVAEPVFVELMSRVQPAVEVPPAPKRAVRTVETSTGTSAPLRYLGVSLTRTEQDALSEHVAALGGVIAKNLTANLAAVIVGSAANDPARMSRAAELGVPVTPIEEFLPVAEQPTEPSMTKEATAVEQTSQSTDPVVAATLEVTVSVAAPAAGWYPDTTAAGWSRWWDGAAWTEHRQPSVAPGWYPDQQDERLLRWWDGGQWTEHTAPQ